MTPGQLCYKGHNVNPATFKRQKIDLRRLVGKCSCGVTLRGKAALPHPEPYASDVYGDNTPIVQCNDCDNESHVYVQHRFGHR